MYPAYYKYLQAYCVTIGSASIYNEMKYFDKLKPKNIPNMAMNCQEICVQIILTLQ
jgi:hypothetical protein